MKILIPGGHLTPALGLIDWIQEHHPQTEMLFVGREYTQVKLKQKAIEFEEISKRGVEFISFKSAKSPRCLLLSPLVALQLVVKVFESMKIIREHRPTVIMSFGGYLAVPIAIAAKLLGVSVLTHEGTSVVGRANRLLFRLANKVVHSYPEFYNFDLESFNKEVVLTGTPIREKILNPVTPKQPEWLPSKASTKKILLVLGGSQGSYAINCLIKDSLVELAKDWTVVHQCGRPNKLYHYQQELLEHAAKNNISSNQYSVKEWIDEADLSWLYSHTQLVFSRAGANTLEELRLYKLPSILLPLPHSYAQEQEMNAKFMADRGAALVINQEEASPTVLLKAIGRAVQEQADIKHNISQLPLPDPRKASSLIFNQLIAVS